MATSTLEYVQKSVTLPKGIVQGVEERVKRGEFSSYLADALEIKLRRDALDDILAEMEAENGPVDEAEVNRLLEWLAE